MGLPRTFVSFSSTDIHYYRLMQAWKANKHINFNFTDCQLNTAILSENEAYIKRLCRERINMAGTLIVLIGKDTYLKHKFVKWEVEVALEKNCRIIAVNLDGSRQLNPSTCPTFLQDIGAVFIPFSAEIVAYALQNWTKQLSGNWYYQNSIYQKLGY